MRAKGDGMHRLLLPLRPRLIIYTAVLLITAILLAALSWSGSIFLVISPITFASLAVIGTHDLLQTRHAVLRNCPLAAHIPLYSRRDPPRRSRQYFLESEKDGTPFSRDESAIVY